MFKVIMQMVLFGFFTVPGFASDSDKWQVDYATSELSFSGTHAGNGFRGAFEEWQADIAFDPSNLKAASLTVKIKTETATTGNGLYDGTITGEDWFHVSAFPEAEFVASRFNHLGENRYEAHGHLTIKDITQPVSFKFELMISDKKADAIGAFTINRTDFGLGVTSDPDAAWVSKEFALDFKVQAIRP